MSIYGCIRAERTNEKGYGITKDGKRAHIVAWEAAHGPVPEGKELDHLCRRRDCYRLEHLEAVSRSENLLRINPAYRYIKLTQCPRGHSYFDHGRRTPELGMICRLCCGL